MHNCNLSIKAILRIAAYGKLFDKENYIEQAKVLAKKGQTGTKGKYAYKLAFDMEDSRSLKYNIIWDKMLDINIFDEKIF